MQYCFLILCLIFLQLPAFAVYEDDGVLLAPEYYSKGTLIDEVKEDPSKKIFERENQMYVESKYGSSKSHRYLNSPKKSRIYGGDSFDRNY